VNLKEHIKKIVPVMAPLSGNLTLQGTGLMDVLIIDNNRLC